MAGREPQKKPTEGPMCDPRRELQLRLGLDAGKLIGGIPVNVSLKHRYWFLFRIPMNHCWWLPLTDSERRRELLNLCKFFPKLPDAQVKIGKWLLAWVFIHKTTSKLIQWLHRHRNVFLFLVTTSILFKIPLLSLLFEHFMHICNAFW